jgi:hypothetical protein
VSFQQVAAPPPQPGRADLDRVEAEAGQFVAESWVRRNVPALVADLRAAREVVKRFQFRLRDHREGCPCTDCEVVAAYDRAVSGP